MPEISDSIRAPLDQLGSYRLRKRLAVGGMGEVYLGEKIGPEGFVKPVVLKCVLPQLASDRAFVQLFLDEARLVALLNHPNIAQVYDFGLVDDIYFIAMEYVPGYTVDDLRRKLRSIDAYMPLEHVACIASQACQGLQYAHALSDANGVGLGLVHRDVSPHNLIVSVDGGVKIVDFGIAKARAGLTRVQAKGAVGKFGYMSPEQSRGELVDGRSDVFSLGVCLWELVTNERLHDPKLDRAPDYDPRRPIRSILEVRRDVPRQFEQIVETALAIDCEDRFRSAQEMHIALERFQAAMTHYAGQSALAQYIHDLVEGKIESPSEGATGLLVEPAAGNRDGTFSPDATAARGAAHPQDGLEGARKYEEVFGVTLDRGRARPRLNVPKSWAVRPSASEPRQSLSEERSKANEVMNAAPRSLAKALEDEAPALHTGLTPRVDGTFIRMKKDPLREERGGVRSRRSSSVPAMILLIVFLCALGAAGFVYRGLLFAWISSAEPTAPTLMSRYRITSEPSGATVRVDGEPEAGVTPMELELIPEVEYSITLRLSERASRRVIVKASISSKVREVLVSLPPAGTLLVATEPPGASVVIDGYPFLDNVTPVRLDDVVAGEELRVTVSGKGRKPQTKTIRVPVGNERKLHFVLERDPG